MCFKLMNPTVRCGQSYLNPGLVWLHTYLDKRLTVTQTQRMDLLTVYLKARHPCLPTEHSMIQSLKKSVHLPSDYISCMASVAYQAAWGALGYLFPKNSIRGIKRVTFRVTLPSVYLHFL